MRFIWVGVAGAAGSVLRYAVGLALGNTHFPWATLGVNLGGAFLLGLVMTLGVDRFPPALVVPITVGLLGGFTTFSAFAWEGLMLTGTGRTTQALGYVGVSVLGGIVAALLGRWAGTAIG